MILEVFQHRILALVLGVCLKVLDTLLVLEKKYLVRALIGAPNYMYL